MHVAQSGRAGLVGLILFENQDDAGTEGVRVRRAARALATESGPQRTSG